MERKIPLLREQLLSGEYQHGGYHYFEIHEPKRRAVAAADFRDRVVHHAVIRVIEPFFEKRFIEDSFACRKGKGTHNGMKRASEFARRFKYALKCDIRRYFANIDHQILMELYGRVIGDKKVLSLLENILASHREGSRFYVPEGGFPLFDGVWVSRGLPIGNLTSQFSANVYLDPLDHFVKHGLRCKGYVRYMDDFLLFSNDKNRLREWGRLIKEKVKSLRLAIHPDKYRLLWCSKGVDFCGFVVFANGRIRIRRDSCRRFYKRFKSRLKMINSGGGDIESLSLSVAAWIGHTRHSQSWNLRSVILANQGWRD